MQLPWCRGSCLAGQQKVFSSRLVKGWGEEFPAHGSSALKAPQAPRVSIDFGFRGFVIFMDEFLPSLLRRGMRGGSWIQIHLSPALSL